MAVNYTMSLNAITEYFQSAVNDDGRFVCNAY